MPDFDESLPAVSEFLPVQEQTCGLNTLPTLPGFSQHVSFDETCDHTLPYVTTHVPFDPDTSHKKIPKWTDSIKEALHKGALQYTNSNEFMRLSQKLAELQSLLESQPPKLKHSPNHSHLQNKSHLQHKDESLTSKLLPPSELMQPHKLEHPTQKHHKPEPKAKQAPKWSSPSPSQHSSFLPEQPSDTSHSSTLIMKRFDSISNNELQAEECVEEEVEDDQAMGRSNYQPSQLGSAMESGVTLASVYEQPKPMAKKKWDLREEKTLKPVKSISLVKTQKEVKGKGWERTSDVLDALEAMAQEEEPEAAEMEGLLDSLLQMVKDSPAKGIKGVPALLKHQEELSEQEKEEELDSETSTQSQQQQEEQQQEEQQESEQDQQEQQQEPAQQSQLLDQSKPQVKKPKKWNAQKSKGLAGAQKGQTEQSDEQEDQQDEQEEESEEQEQEEQEDQDQENQQQQTQLSQQLSTKQSTMHVSNELYQQYFQKL